MKDKKIKRDSTVLNGGKIHRFVRSYKGSSLDVMTFDGNRVSNYGPAGIGSGSLPRE